MPKLIFFQLMKKNQLSKKIIKSFLKNIIIIIKIYTSISQKPI